MGRVHAPALPLWQCPPIARTNSMRTAMSCHIVSCYCCPASLLFPSVGHHRRTRSNAPTLNTTYLDGSYVFIADVPSLIKFASTTPHSATAHAFALGFRFCPRLC